MVTGCLISSLGCVIVATSQSLFGFVLGFSVLVGAGGVFYKNLPSQALITRWFNDYRARALAVFSTSSAVGTFLWLRLHSVIEQTFDWRTGWWIAAATKLVLAVTIPVFVREYPEDKKNVVEGQNKAEASSAATLHRVPVAIGYQSVWSVVRSPQFILIVLLGIAAAAPNVLVLVHGRLHLEAVGLSQGQAVQVLSVAALISVIGRLASGIGDFMSPIKLLWTVLVVEVLGAIGLIFAANSMMAYASIAAIGIGTGAGLQLITLIMSQIFPLEIFPPLQGVRAAFVGGISAVIPWLVGMSADTTGSYTSALIVQAGSLFFLVMAGMYVLQRGD